MTVALAQPFRAIAWSCRAESLPARSVLDLISDRPNRWNRQGEPTIYVSGDAALALLEAGRHPDDLIGRSRLIEVDLRMPSAIDLREENVRAALELTRPLDWILDRERTREIARSLRQSGSCDGLIVPSAGALDQPARWNAVVFAEDRARLADLIRLIRPVGQVDLSPPSTPARRSSGAWQACRSPARR
jgi:RES domain-containing protein